MIFKQTILTLSHLIYEPTALKGSVTQYVEVYVFVHVGKSNIRGLDCPIDSYFEVVDEKKYEESLGLHAFLMYVLLT